MNGAWPWRRSFQGQAVDELGMICASLAFLYVVLEVGHLDPWRRKCRTEMSCTWQQACEHLLFQYMFNAKDGHS